MMGLTKGHPPVIIQQPLGRVWRISGVIRCVLRRQLTPGRRNVTYFELSRSTLALQHTIIVVNPNKRDDKIGKPNQMHELLETCNCLIRDLVWLTRIGLQEINQHVVPDMHIPVFCILKQLGNMSKVAMWHIIIR